MLIVLVATIGVLTWFALKHMRKRREWDEFQRASRKAGLRKEESDLLKQVAKSAGAKNLSTVLTANDVFEQGVTALMQSSRVAALSDNIQARLGAMFGAMREKLGLGQPLTENLVVFKSTRQLPAGSKLAIMSQTGAEAAKATVFGNDPAELVVEGDALPEIRPEDVWIVRYFHGKAAWEFDAPVLRDEQGKAVLGHSKEVRTINCRRFARVAANAPAQVACFSFHGEDPRQETPRFLPATLVEIAGPGLVLESSLQAAIGERVLVVVKLGQERLVQGVAKVLRALPRRAGGISLAVELLGLDDDEIAELAQETCLAASRQIHRGAEAAEATA